MTDCPLPIVNYLIYLSELAVSGPIGPTSRLHWNSNPGCWYLYRLSWHSQLDLCHLLPSHHKSMVSRTCHHLIFPRWSMEREEHHPYLRRLLFRWHSCQANHVACLYCGTSRNWSRGLLWSSFHHLNLCCLCRRLLLVLCFLWCQFLMCFSWISISRMMSASHFWIDLIFESEGPGLCHSSYPCLAEVISFVFRVQDHPFRLPYFLAFSKVLPCSIVLIQKANERDWNCCFHFLLVIEASWRLLTLPMTFSVTFQDHNHQSLRPKRDLMKSFNWQ